MELLRKAIVSYLITLCYGTALVIFSLCWPASAFTEEGSGNKEIRRFNIKPTTPWPPATYQRDALVSKELIKEGGQPATPIVMDYLTQQGEQWLNQFGRAKIALRGDTLRSLQGQAALLLPINHNEQWLWFAQGGWVQSRHRSTFSLGTGQRQFYSKQGYWGNNLFFDYQPQGNHYRLGLGLEQGYQAFSSQINGYLPLSDAQLINNSADQANPALGIDIRLRYQPPQWPYWRFSVTGDHYWGTLATAGSSSLVKNPTALTAGIHYTPIPLVVLGYHLRWNLPGRLVHRLSCSLNYRLGIPWEQQVNRQQVMHQALEIDRLKLVSRHHEMVLQQQPNDQIKLEIENISPGEHHPGDTIQVKVRVATPRPLNEWQFSWVGIPVNTQPSIKAKEEIQIVTLPSKSGTCMLQLQGRNIRDVVVYSNLLTLKISSAKTVTTSNMDSDDLSGFPGAKSMDYRLDIPREQQEDRRQVIRQSLEIDHPKLVSRRHEMELQQQPNDEIKLEIENISPGEYQPGSTIQVRVRVATPRPLNEWQFSWVGIPVNTQPSIKDSEGNETLTLPSKSGIYTLQLQACHARGKIACSNTLQLKVGVEEQEGSKSYNETTSEYSRLTEENLKKHDEIERGRLRKQREKELGAEAENLVENTLVIFETACKKNNWVEGIESGQLYKEVLKNKDIVIAIMTSKRLTPSDLTRARVFIKKGIMDLSNMEIEDYPKWASNIMTKDYFKQLETGQPEVQIN